MEAASEHKGVLRVFFCPFCGSKRSMNQSPKGGAKIQCGICLKEESIYDLEKFLKREVQVRDLPMSESMRRLMANKKSRPDALKHAEETINEACPKCNHPEQSYHTAQLRGLDEGQTVFYTCLNKACGYKHVLNT